MAHRGPLSMDDSTLQLLLLSCSSGSIVVIEDM